MQQQVTNRSQNRSPRQISLSLPNIEAFKKPTVPKKINFNMMLNLPLIVKEKSIFERKNTIDVFKKKKLLSHMDDRKRDKGQFMSPGKIFINEFWSKKYQQSVLNESKIQDQLDQLQGLIRRNMDELLSDVHKALERNGQIPDNKPQATHSISNILPPEYKMRKGSAVQSNQTDQSGIEILMDDDKNIKQNVYKKKHLRLKSDHQDPKRLQAKQLVGSRVSETHDKPQEMSLFANSHLSTQGNGKSLGQVKSEMHILMQKCLQARYPNKDMELIAHKPWLQNSAKTFVPNHSSQKRSSKRKITKLNISQDKDILTT